MSVFFYFVGVNYYQNPEKIAALEGIHKFLIETRELKMKKEIMRGIGAGFLNIMRKSSAKKSKEVSPRKIRTNVNDSADEDEDLDKVEVKKEAKPNTALCLQTLL